MKVYELKKILSKLPEEADDLNIEMHCGVIGNIDGLCGVIYDAKYVHFYGYGFEGTCLAKGFLNGD